MSYKAALRVWRGDKGQGELTGYTVEVNEGEVVLDVLHRLQATQAPGHQPVDARVVVGGGFPAHAADEAESFHEYLSRL